jgi:glycosyltransferase involved in cell wall biosynthesis
MKILHIAPHLGGGVGRFLSNIVCADSQNQHEFCLLETPIDTHLLSNISWQTIDMISTQFEEYVDNFDIIQIEFWNHPLLFKFLLKYSLPACNLIIYAHVSGMYPPNLIPPMFFDYADIVVLSTPASSKYYSDQIQRGKCRVIHGIGGFSQIGEVIKNKHEGINIVYIGTVSHSKIHPGFIQACWSILKQSPHVKFFVASNDDNSHLIAEAEDFGIRDRIEFLYRIDDISIVLGQADIFGYPLRPDHFGTGEQALLEAMGAGIPPVVIGNPAELSLIKDGETGLIASDIYDYVSTIHYCIKNRDFLQRIGEQTQEYAGKNYTVNVTLLHFIKLYEEVLTMPKVKRNFNEFFSYDMKNPGWSLFKLCLGNYPDLLCYERADDHMAKQYFRDKIMRSPHLMNENKGGMKIYFKYFPEDSEFNEFLFNTVDKN